MSVVRSGEGRVGIGQVSDRGEMPPSSLHISRCVLFGCRAGSNLVIMTSVVDAGMVVGQVGEARGPLVPKGSPGSTGLPGSIEGSSLEGGMSGMTLNSC